jgi:hypothetical protein
MDFEGFFKNELDGLHQEGRYRVFADLARHRGDFPKATAARKSQSGARTTISAWVNLRSSPKR